MLGDKIILVDERDREVGVEEKMEVHKRGLLHRAFSIFVFNSEDKLLLQQRALSKYHSGGLWSNTCCSHPRSGENLDEAVHRRLLEEMGFDCPLEEVFSFIYKITFDNGLTEHEYDHVFKGVYDGEVDPNPLEVMQYKWCTWEEVKDGIEKSPGKYAFWFREIVRLWETNIASN